MAATMTYIEPFTFVFLCVAFAGLWGLRHQWRTAWWRIAFSGAVGLGLLSWPPAGAILAIPLTSRYVREVRPSGDAEAIVVLSGTVLDPSARRPYALVGRDTYRRIMHAAWLYHNWKPLPILATGGRVSSGGEPASVAMRRIIEQQGVPASKIWTEEQSRSTFENAVYSAKLLHGRGIHQIALVTEADSMLRAELCFRKQGLGVTPAPSLFRDFEFTGDDLLPGWQGMYRQEILLHEGIGLLWYWIRGRI